MHFTLVLSLSFDEVELRIGAHILVKYTRRTIAITIEAHYNILFPCSLPWKKYFRLVNLYRGNDEWNRQRLFISQTTIYT